MCREQFKYAANFRAKRERKRVIYRLFQTPHTRVRTKYGTKACVSAQCLCREEQELFVIVFIRLLCTRWVVLSLLSLSVFLSCPTYGVMSQCACLCESSKRPKINYSMSISRLLYYFPATTETSVHSWAMWWNIDEADSQRRELICSIAIDHFVWSVLNGSTLQICLFYSDVCIKSLKETDHLLHERLHGTSVCVCRSASVLQCHWFTSTVYV